MIKVLKKVHGIILAKHRVICYNIDKCVEADTKKKWRIKNLWQRK